MFKNSYTTVKNHLNRNKHETDKKLKNIEK